MRTTRPSRDPGVVYHYVKPAKLFHDAFYDSVNLVMLAQRQQRQPSLPVLPIPPAAVSFLPTHYHLDALNDQMLNNCFPMPLVAL